MELFPTTIEGMFLLKPKVFKDSRGFFLESYSYNVLNNLGINTVFIQDNHAYSSTKGVLRGLHFQIPPYSQIKLVRVTRGSVYDVVVDVRKESTTFGMWEGFELRADNFSMLYIPKGCAHGYYTLEDHTEFMYKVDQPYMPEFERGILWSDPSLNITWPSTNPLLSIKDCALPLLKDAQVPFY